MITCYIRYVIDIHKTAEFERYSRLWLDIVPRLGGTHHGYFLPSEGAIDIALALFSFPSFAAYELYRQTLGTDPQARQALDYAARTRCFLRYERSFFRPLLSAEAPPATAQLHDQDVP